MKKIIGLLLVVCSVLLMTGCGIRPERACFLHYTNRYGVVSIEVVRVGDFEPGSAITHEVLCTVPDVEAFVDDIIELDVVERNDDANRTGIRENTMVFKITYNCGCVDFFDAAGSSFELVDECVRFYDKKYVYEGSLYTYDEDQFAARIQKYLDVAVSAGELADA